MHTVGNNPRNHAIYARWRNCSGSMPAYPAANLEPYYAGWNHSINRPGGETPEENSARDNYFARAMMYGSVLSGALAGHVLWHRRLRRHEHRRTRRLAAAHLDGVALRVRRTDAAPAQLHAVGRRALPAADAGVTGSRAAQHSGVAGRRTRRLVVPHAHARRAISRWRTSRTQAMRPSLAGFTPRTNYRWRWFDPRSGEWSQELPVKADAQGVIDAPAFPDGGNQAAKDIAAKIIRAT